MGFCHQLERIHLVTLLRTEMRPNSQEYATWHSSLRGRVLRSGAQPDRSRRSRVERDDRVGAVGGPADGLICHRKVGNFQIYWAIEFAPPEALESQ